jgi:hypothetical protein
LHNEFEENLLLDDLDIDELIECDDIEQTAFLSSSKQLMSVIDNVLTCIDDRISQKRSGSGYYMGGQMYYGYNQDEYGGSHSHFNNNLYGYHKQQQSQSTSIHHYGNERSSGVGGRGAGNMGHGHGSSNNEGFDKTRKISVLY